MIILPIFDIHRYFFISFFTRDMNDMVVQQHHQYTDDTDWFDNSFYSVRNIMDQSQI